VIHPKLDLSETVPYVGGAAVQATGIIGAGVRALCAGHVAALGEHRDRALLMMYRTNAGSESQELVIR
jgi:hypothetical protein